MTVTKITVSQLINCKIADAFDAFVEPRKITQFWLNSTSEPLSKGAKVTWQFMVPGAVDTVIIDHFERPSLIQLTWSDGTKTRFEFSEISPDKTKISITAEVSASEDIIDQVVNTTEGFSIVLCDLKTLLESGRSANLVRAKAELITSSMAASEGDA